MARRGNSRIARTSASADTRGEFNTIASSLTSLSKNIDYLVPPTGLQDKLEISKRESRPLIIKLGFDPTAPDLHLGHAVVLKKLRDFQNAGHQVVVIIGDFTARIGDPTGRNSARPPLSRETVEKNARTYIAQLSKILDISKISIRYNSEWLSKMSSEDNINLLAKFTLSQILERSDFGKRYKDQAPIHLHELYYPLLQGQDSVIIDADVEIGGTDQLFNCQVGRALQEKAGKQPQIVISMPLLVGLDGHERMSKSENNYIALTDEPNDMYGKIMSIPDTLIPNYLDLVTSFDDEKIGQLKGQLADGTNPMVIKKLIAANVVEQYHGEEFAKKADLYFFNQFQDKDGSNKQYEPVGLSKIFGESSDIGIVDMCRNAGSGLTGGAIRRLISGGGVSLNGEKISNPKLRVVKPVNGEITLKVGSDHYAIGQKYDLL